VRPVTHAAGEATDVAATQIRCHTMTHVCAWINAKFAAGSVSRYIDVGYIKPHRNKAEISHKSPYRW
jgi:hypothetical protein